MLVVLTLGRIFETAVMRAFNTSAKPSARNDGALLDTFSTRELYNLVWAQMQGFDIITMGPDLLAKMDLLGKDLEEYSRETVAQFVSDGKGLSL